MSRPPIADDLREYADFLNERGIIPAIDYYILTNIADEIDAEHRRRMYQQSHDIRKAACRYFASVVEDYRRGRKRVRQ
jgi:hypothetical protein